MIIKVLWFNFSCMLNINPTLSALLSTHQTVEGEKLQGKKNNTWLFKKVLSYLNDKVLF